MINLAPAMRFPLGYLYAMAPLCMFVGIIRTIQIIIEDITKTTSGTSQGGK
jgi:TRAP-type C4-dicarboxylate transport system permease small subunit